ncbi:hypothetical protein EJB05_58062, partial [Eragrostis curvula]
MLACSAAAAGAVAVRALHLPSVPGLPTAAASTAEISANGAELLKLSLDGARPQVAALRAELRPAVDAVLFDFATPWVCDVAAPLGVTALFFNVFSAAAIAYMFVPARGRGHGVDGRRQLPSADDLTSAPAGFPPGSALAAPLPAYQAAELTYAYASFHGMPCVYKRFVASLEHSAGSVMKTCAEMEGPYVSYISAQLGGKPVLLAGPVVPEPPRGELNEEEPWASWLSSFPDDAVVFASFGSETVPARPGRDGAPRSSAWRRPTARSSQCSTSPNPWTPRPSSTRGPRPAGFRQRVKGRGVVRTGWMKQQHILRHRSVGCYVNHAGFSSVVEGLVAGCRLVLLPLKNDQYFNAALFGARELRVGVEVARREEDGWFGHYDVSEAVAAAMAADGEGDARKWREFLMDDAVQTKFADKFIEDLKQIEPIRSIANIQMSRRHRSLNP